MNATLLSWAQSLQDTAFATALAESRYEFPILEGFHLIGLSLSVGLIAIIDLRLVGGFLPSVPAREVLRQLRPWVLAGFALTFASGTLLFASEAVSVIKSPAFPFKLAFIFLAGLNALWFEWQLARTGRSPDVATGGAARWATEEASATVPAAPPVSPVRLTLAAGAGAASLALWFLVVASGRLIPYITSW